MNKNKISPPFNWDPDAPILHTSGIDPMAHLRDYNGNSHNNDNEEIFLRESYSSVAVSPLVADVISLTFRKVYKCTRADRVSISEIFDFITRDNDHVDGDGSGTILTVGDKINASLLNIYELYCGRIANLYAEPDKYLTKSDHQHENNEFQNEIQPLQKILHQHGLYHIPNIEKQLATIIGFRNIMAFKVMNERADSIKANDDYWKIYYDQINNYNKSFRHGDILNNGTSMAIADIDMVRFFLNMVNLENMVDTYKNVSLSESGFMKRFFSNVVRASLRCLSKSLQDISNFDDIALKIINLDEYLISIVNFLIDYAAYYNAGEDPNLLPISMPIPMRLLIEFDWNIPRDVMSNNMSIAYMLNHQDISMPEVRRQRLDKALWNETITLYSIRDMPNFPREMFAPQLWNYAYYMGLRVPYVDKKGFYSMTKKQIFELNKEVTEARAFIRTPGIMAPRSLAIGTHASIKRHMGKYDELGSLITFFSKY